MNNILKTFILLFCVVAVTFTACKKDDDDTATACSSGNNFCFKLDGTLVEGNATFREINPTRLRIEWETNTGGTYKSVEIDINANATGTYSVDKSYSANTAALQYFEGEGFYGTSGEVKVDNLSATSITGTFNGTVTDDNGNSKQITDGNFSSVPKQ